MNADAPAVVAKSYRYTMGWIFPVALVGVCGLGIWSYQLDGLPTALVLAGVGGIILVAYLEWSTFSLRLDGNAIHYGSAFYRKAVPFNSIKSVDHVFGKNSDFVVVRPRVGRSFTVWMYLQDFRNVLAQINSRALQAGALVRTRDKWGKWSTRPHGYGPNEP